MKVLFLVIFLVLLRNRYMLCEFSLLLTSLRLLEFQFRFRFCRFLLHFPHGVDDFRALLHVLFVHLQKTLVLQFHLFVLLFGFLQILKRVGEDGGLN